MSLMKVTLDKKKYESSIIFERINRANEEIVDAILSKLSEDLGYCISEKETHAVIQNIDFSDVIFEYNRLGCFSCNLHARSKGLVVNTMTNTIPSPYFFNNSSPFWNDYSSTTTINTGKNLNTSTSVQNAPTNYHSNLTFDSSMFLKAVSKISIDAGHEVTIDLPNGAVLEIKKSGNIKITDVDSKVTYKACGVREFNRFINASDLLQDFIKFLGSKGVKQGRVLDIPVELFINWLVFKSAEQDEDLPPENMIPTESHPKLLIAKKKKMPPKCLCCGKFIKKDLAEKGFNFCSGNHASKFATEKLALAG